MDVLVQFLIEYGYFGMFLSAFLAGTAFPFNSELVMLGLSAAGLNPVWLILWGSLGNVAGGMTCYWLGCLGKLSWIERYAGVKPEKLERVQRFISTRGWWMAFFAFLPGLGSAICIVLGIMRANKWLTMLAMALGKSSRYCLFAFAPHWFM